MKFDINTILENLADAGCSAKEIETAKAPQLRRKFVRWSKNIKADLPVVTWIKGQQLNF